MKKEVGLWIDHREAVIVTLQDQKQEIQRVMSDVENQVLYSGNSETRVTTEAHAHNDGAVAKGDRRIEGHFDPFYDAVITHLDDATAILIMGPGDAKNEFHKHMEERLPATKFVNVEAADKMTDEQIVAKVRRNFELYKFTH